MFLLLAACGLPSASAQQDTGEVALIDLVNPTYPPMAALANITGDVEVRLGIGRDGSIESAVVVSGQPMLGQAALASARQSRFECRGCNKGVTIYPLFYSFRLAAGPNFPCSSSHQHVTLLQNHVNVTGEPRVVHPQFSNVRVRSVKCMYLWACGSRWGGEDYYFYPARSAKCLDLWHCGHRLREPFATCRRLHQDIW